MAEQEASQDAAPKKSRRAILIGVLMMLALGAAGFFATYSGMLVGSKAEGSANEHGEPVAGLPEIAFVQINPLVISLGAATRSMHLRFTSQLEVEKAHEAEVAMLMPRILDVLNGYLRAVEVSEIEDPSALIRLRAQMLRRIQMVTGEGRVRDLLVTEFVLN